MTVTSEQILIAGATVLVFPAALWWFKRSIVKRDDKAHKEKQSADAVIAAKLDMMDVKLDNSDKNMLEFRADIRKDIIALHERIGDFKTANEEAHKDLRMDLNDLKVKHGERIAKIETMHNAMHKNCLLEEEAKDG